MNNRNQLACILKHLALRLSLPLLLMPFVATAARAQGDGQYADQAVQPDPPDRVGRLSVLQGAVSFQPASASGEASFVQAELNLTMTAGDRLYTAQDGLSEVQSDNVALRLGGLTDLTLTTMSQQYMQLGLALGSLRVRTYAVPPGSAIEIDTANGAFTILRAGDIRIDAYPGHQGRPDTTIVTVNAGRVQANGEGVDTVTESGQSLRVDGETPASARFVEAQEPDNLDRFDQDRDAQRAAAAASIREQYVNPGMIGYDDLDAYGTWTPSPDYGQVWYPRGIEAGWSPYHNGHWAYVSPWGYTWVESEPWGFAPFHYGRWANIDGRWGWIPGPAVVRPIYSPALVAFVGGGNFSLSISVGGNGGGVAAWFPLGPREPFVPWYRASPGYVNRVNVSNIYNRNTVEVRNVYVNRTTNVYVNNTATINYVNRNVGTVAVPQQAFVAGRNVKEAQVRVDPRQLQQAQVVSRPPQAPAHPGPTQGLAPARVMPQNQARPNFQVRGPQNATGGSPSDSPIRSAQPSPVHTPGSMRPAPGNPEIVGTPERPAATPQQSAQELRPIGGGRSPRPVEVTAPLAAPVTRPAAPVVRRPEAAAGGRTLPADGAAKPAAPAAKAVQPTPAKKDEGKDAKRDATAPKPQ